MQNLYHFRRSKKSSQKKITSELLIVLFIIILIFISMLTILKELNVPILNHKQALAYVEDSVCLGFRTGTWNKDVRDARKVKILKDGKKEWFYTDFDTAREIWNKYNKEIK